MLIPTVIIVLTVTYNAAFAQDATPQYVPAKTEEVGLVFSSLNSFGLRYKCGNENTLFRITALSLTGTNTENDYNNYAFNGVNGAVPNSPTNTLGAGLNIGFEKRKHINENFYLYYGLDWINSYTQSQTQITTPGTSLYTYTDNNGVFTTESAVVNNISNNNTYTISTGLGIVLGIACKINNSLSIAAELIPSASYKYTKTTAETTTYAVHWAGTTTAGYTPDIYTSSDVASTIVNKGVTYSLTNAAASLTLAYKIK